MRATTAPSSRNEPASAALDRPLRLLQVLGYAGAAGERFGITGVERVVELLLSGLDARRFEHYLAYPAAGELLGRYREHAKDILTRESTRRYDRAYLDALERFMRRNEVDVVLSHGFLRTDFLAALACRRARVPHVVSRAVPLADEQLPLLRRLLYAIPDAWTLRRCRAVIACSQATRRRMARTQRIPTEKITVIPNGVDLPRVSEARRREARRALEVDDDSILVGGVGQLIPRKAFVNLVEAVALARARHPNLVCVILGEGPERGTLEALARERGVRLLLPGYVSDPYPTVAAFDVAVLPSRAEGMPLVVLEAMALGVPTLATAVAGTPEVIEDGTSGLLVPPDDVRALTAALERLADSPELRSRLGGAGARRTATHFSLEVMMRGFDACLTRAAAQRVP